MKSCTNCNHMAICKHYQSVREFEGKMILIPYSVIKMIHEELQKACGSYLEVK